MVSRLIKRPKRLVEKLPRETQLALLALLIFVVLATTLINRALFPGYTLLPLDLIQDIAPWDHLDFGPLANPLISDPFYSFFPRRFFLTAAIKGGQIPLWNPNILSGTPAFANPNFQPFYPPNLVAALILPAQHALPWLAWGHLILTGWLMFLFLKQQKLRWLAAVMGGGVWMLNSYIVVWLENPHRLSTLAWFPGIFWAYQKAIDEKRLDFAAIGGLFLGFAILGGQTQFIYGIGLVLGIYALSHLAWDVHKLRRFPVQPLISLAVSGIIGLGIGAIILLPAFEFSAFSQRFRFSVDAVLSTRFPWQNAVTLVAPDFFGNPVNAEYYWGHLPNYAELAVYFGVAALFLALTAPFVTRHTKFRFTATTTTLFVIAIVMGTPLVRILQSFPGSQFVVLNRLLFLVPLVACWLAALGLDGWLSGSRKSRLIFISPLVLIGILVAVTIRNQGVTPSTRPGTYYDLLRSAIILLVAIGLLLILPRHSRIVGGLLVLLAFTDLFQALWDFNPITSTDYLYPQSEVVDYLHRDETLYRVLPLQSERIIFGPNVPGIYGIQTIGGYTPLIRSDYYDLYKRISDQVDFFWLKSSPNKLAMSVFEPMVSILNVKYILSNKPLDTSEILQVERTGCDTTVSAKGAWLNSTFTATKPGLNRIDIVQAPQAVHDGNSTVKFRLWRDEIDGDLIVDSDIAVLSADSPTIQTIYFEPVADSAGQRFILGIYGDDGNLFCAVGEDQELAFSAFGAELIFRGEFNDVLIYENPNTLPRTYLVHHVETVESGTELDKLFDPDFDTYHSVVIDEPLTDEEYSKLATMPIRQQGSVEIVEYDLHNVEMHVTLDRPGILVFLDEYYPGWEVRVDGSKREILEVNNVFRGVFLDQGTYSVSFRFRPDTLTIGIGSAIVSLLLVVVLVLLTIRNRKASAPRNKIEDIVSEPPSRLGLTDNSKPTTMDR